MTLSFKSLVRNPQRPPSTPLLDPPSWHTSDWDINTKFSGYLPWGKKHHSWLHGWLCPPCVRSGTLNILQVTTFLTPLLDTLLIEIMTLHFLGMFLRVKEHHSWRQVLPCHPCLRSGTLNILQVPPWRTPHSWHTSNSDIDRKFSGYLPWGKNTSFMTPGMTQSSMSPVKTFNVLQVHPSWPPSWHTSSWDINTKFSGYVP